MLKFIRKSEKVMYVEIDPNEVVLVISNKIVANVLGNTNMEELSKMTDLPVKTICPQLLIRLHECIQRDDHEYKCNDCNRTFEDLQDVRTLDYGARLVHTCWRCIAQAHL